MNKQIDLKTGITIIPERDTSVNDFSMKLLKDFYLRANETPQEGYARACKAWSNGDNDLAQRLYDAVSQGWFMFASPVLSNAPLPGEKIKGLPISCFLTQVPDSLEGLIDHTVEFRWLSVLGGGVGGHWSTVRSVSDKSPGPIPFIHTVDSDMEAYKQGKVRRGSYAAYMDISHPDIVEFLNLRVPTGDASRKCHSTGFHNAINITDAFMDAVISDSSWALVDPASKLTKETVKARQLWQEILEIRYRTGEPYLCFIDEANRKLPEAQKAIGLRINGSNLCVTGDTLIDIKIKDIETKIRMDQFVEEYTLGYYEGLNPLVKSYDFDKKEVVWQSVSAAGETGKTQDLIRIETEDGKVLECTEDHQIFTTNRGWVKAGELMENDDLVIE